MFNKIKKLVENNLFQNFIIIVIILNGITMGFETSTIFATKYDNFFHIFNLLVVTIFTIEIILRIYVYRKSFFTDSWSLFDFVIVALSLMPTHGGFEIFRILRVFRLFRIITVVPQMRKIIGALMNIIPGIASIAGLMILFFYIFAIMATNLFGDDFPQWFGSLGDSFYTLFQVMTLESWSMGIVRPIMEVQPYAWVFFVPFIFLVTFIMINLIIAIVVDAMNEIKDDEEKHILDKIGITETHTAKEIKKLQNDIAELKNLIIKIDYNTKSRGKLEY